MKRTIVIAALVLALVTGSAWAQGGDDNLLTNPSFEAPFTERRDRVIVAHGWEPAHWDRYMPTVSDGGSSGPIIQPEYKESPISLDAKRVTDGQSAQCLFWAFAVGDSVLYQTVDVEPGKCYQAGFAASSWVSQKEDTYVDGEMFFNVGLSPEARTFAWDTGVIWNEYKWSGWEYREVESRVVQATGPQMTMFVRATSKWAMRHNDAYLDRAWLREVPCGNGSTECPACPTPEPCPTCPPCEPGSGEAVDYERIDQIVRDAWRELWPGVE